MAVTTHTVVAGECLSTIAARYGMPWKKVWEAPENEALRKKRKSPNVLAPGDLVRIPRAEAKETKLELKKLNSFVLKREKVEFHLRLTAGQEPIGGEPYVLEWPDHKVEGKTDGEGQIHATIPVSLQKMTLTLPKRRQTYTLALGEIDPLNTVRGAQTRLYNLGLYQGELTGDLDEATRSAVEMFQGAVGVAVTGEYDEKTQKALGDLYGF